MAPSDKLVLCIFLSVFTVIAEAQTINGIIKSNNEELSELYYFIKGLSFFTSALDNTNAQTTFFAPNNAAFLKLPQSLRTTYNPQNQNTIVKAELSEIFRYHSGSVVKRNSDFVDGEFLDSISYDGCKLVVRKVNQSLYINGARILPWFTDLQASNGIVHIVDTVILPVGVPGSVYVFLKATEQYKKFLQLLDAYSLEMDRAFPSETNAKTLLFTRTSRVTVFAPTDLWINRNMNQNKFNQILNSIDTLKRVVESHVIDGSVWHQRLLRDRGTAPIRAMYGNIVSSTFGDSLYVANECVKGKVVSADQTMDNGVVHVIEGLLGYVYNDLLDKLSERSELNDFGALMGGLRSIRELIDLPSGQETAASDRTFTILAPTRSGLDGAENIYTEKLEETLKMHMIPGRLPLVELTNGTVRDTLRAGFPATFFQIIDSKGTTEIYVEVNQVRSKLLEADICTYNGLIHIVDHVIGEPTKSFWEMIDTTRQFTTLYELGRRSGYDSKLREESSRFTFFAPTNEAFELMRETAAGLRILENTMYLRNVLDRHLVAGEVILTESMLSGDQRRTYQTEHKDEEIQVTMSNGRYLVEFGPYQIHITQPNQRMTNGIMHTIDEVIYSTAADASDGIMHTIDEVIYSTAADASELVGAGQSVAANPALLAITTLLSLAAVLRHSSALTPVLT